MESFGSLSNRRWLVECIGMFFIGVCRLPGRVLSVACGMHRYVLHRCVPVGAWLRRHMPHSAHLRGQSGLRPAIPICWEAFSEVGPRLFIVLDDS